MTVATRETHREELLSVGLGVNGGREALNPCVYHYSINHITTLLMIFFPICVYMYIRAPEIYIGCMILEMGGVLLGIRKQEKRNASL